MELLEAFYRRKLRKKQKKAELGRSDGALCRSPSEASVNGLATGLISKVLRFTSRRSEPASRPHSWHSTKLAEAQQQTDQAGMETMSSAWHHSYHTSASTTDLSGGFDAGGYLRKSPDQYSSRGSMESLDPPPSSQLHPGAQHHHHPLGHHTLSGPHPAYSSCHQLSSARSSNSIDHLHSKRDSAYSSFSTSSSIPEYLASHASFSPERSYSLETVPQREGGGADMQQADICYVRTVYDAQQGLSQEHELSSASTASLRNSDSRGGGGSRQGSVGGVCYRGSSSSGSSSSGSSSGGAPASNRHSVGPIWGPAASRSSYESLKGAPAPPRRSDSYAAIRNHERPNSWSSLEHGRSLRSLQKGSWHHSSGPVASSAAKGSFSTEGQLHTVMEKSPESSPTTKPRQGGGFPQSPSPTGPSSGPAAPPPQSGRLILPAGVYPVPQLEPHYAQMPTSSPGPGSSGVYPALAKESSRQQLQGGGRAAENGYQNNISSSIYPHSSSSSPASTQLRTPDRPLQEDSNSELYSSPLNPAGEGSEDQTDFGPNHQRPSSQRPNSQVSQEQNQDFFIPHTAGPRLPSSQDWREPSVPVQSRGDKSSSTDQTSVPSEPVASSRLAQGQVPPSHPPVHPHPLAFHPPASRHLSDSAALLYQRWDHRDRDRDHPLTRLEIALAEVQRCASPNSVVSNHDDIDGIRGLSVLEKVSRFERRDRTGKQQNQPSESGRSTPCGAEDLRNMLKRSASRTKVHRTMSYRGASSEHMKHRAPADPSSALQRSRSSYQLDEPREEDDRKDFPRTLDIQEMLGSMQDTSYNRSYRDSLKDAQSKVLRSTSFRRRDLNSSSSSSHQPPPVPAKSPEKKGPKTMPKPQGVVITPPPVASLHTPKERHVVSPETRGPNPPALPSVPPVGPPSLIRICGRRRLTMDQKKRSFSEPDNLNEVGVSDKETAALLRRGGETSVADRRKMFELGANRVQNATSKPDLRRLQQDALADYMERKRSVKRDKGEQRGGARPRSAYLQPENSHYAASSCLSDTLSLSSTSSLLSLQDSSREAHLHSTLPPGSDLWSLQSGFFHPGRVTGPGAPPHPPPGSQTLQDNTSDPGTSRQSQTSSRDLNLGLGLSRQLDWALQRAGSAGKSASAEDLLERSEEMLIPPQHYRSRSSPSAERLNQDFPPGDGRMFGAFLSEAGRRSLAEDRPAEVQLSSPQRSTVQPAASSQDSGSFHTPPSRKERQRTSERQRGPSTSTLAASVGLPCPLSPPGSQDGGSAEWRASERLSQANLDAITFPGTMQPDVETMATRHSLSDGSVVEDTKDTERASPLQLSSPPTRRDSGSPSHQPSTRLLSSLRISESSLLDQQPSLGDSFTSLSLDKYNEVFFQNSASSPPPVKETSILEDFPPPPPPLELEQEAGLQTVGRTSSLHCPPSSTSPPEPILPPSVKPQPSTTTSTSYSTTQDLGLEYQPLPKREKTPEELQVEVLSRQLVLQDGSLAPLLDTWGGKSTVELMEEMFPNSRLAGKSPWQRRGSSRLDERIQDGVCDPAQSMTTDLDEAEKDLNTRKVELCEALRSSVAALRRQKEALSEEQRRHQALGASVETLVQERLKPNEREKYSMFIGDLEKIVNLLLSLCSRLSRMDRSLLALEREGLTEEDTVDERDCLLHKRSLLLSQTEDARELKENLDRRQRVVHGILSACLSEPQLQDYRRFVSAKPSLLIRQRQIDDLIRQAEDQLTRLAESLPLELAEAHGWSRSCLLSSSSPTSHYSALLPPLLPPYVTPVRSTTVTSL